MMSELAHYPLRPLLVFAMPISKAHTERISRAAKSFRDQVYPHWELHIVGTDLAPSIRQWLHTLAQQDARITFVEAGNEKLARRQAWSMLMCSSGTYVGMIEQHVELVPHALYVVAKTLIHGENVDAVYGDHDCLGPDGDLMRPFFKPGWDPDLLLSMDYLSPLCVFRREAILNGEEWQNVVENDGCYGLALRFTDLPRNITHVPEVLCHAGSGSGQEGHPTDVESNESVDTNGSATVSAALRRRKEAGSVVSLGAGPRRVRFHPVRDDLVSVIIPTRDRCDLLKQCVDSIETHTRHVRYEIIVADNGTTDSATLRYLDELARRHRVFRQPGAFNYSAINNEGVKRAGGAYLLFLNNDTEVLTADWLSDMVGQAQRPDVGGVGVKLLYSDGRIQHAGVVLGVCGAAGHAFRHCSNAYPYYHGLSDVMRSCSAVTGACLMVSRTLFDEVGGFDEHLPVEFNDVDLCLKIRQRGYRIVYDPAVVLYHHENATRKGRLSPRDEKRFVELWGDVLAKGDPYYNPNLTLRREDWSLDI
jgi:GT2 family glycosyltransferase